MTQEKQTPQEDDKKIEAVTPHEKPKRDIKKELTEFLRTKKGKITAIVAAVIAVLVVVFAIPSTRYAVVGLVVKKDVTVAVVDNATNKPVSGVLLTLGAQTVRSDGNGKAILYNVPVGEWQVTVKKNYYQDAKVNVLVPILIGQSTLRVSMVATGRQVPVAVINKLTGKPLASAEITAGDSNATTDSDGKAIIVLPAGKDVINATFKANGYNTVTADISVIEQEDAKNTFAITPSGKIYFLSKRTGQINVMKSDLDGANAAVVVTATGKESDTDTTLLASRDWQYLALKAKRDSPDPKLYLINTSTEKLTVIDEGTNGTYFTPIGWYNEHFIYRVDRPSVQSWQPNRASLKTFDAKANKIATIDDAAGEGTGANSWADEEYSQVYILDNLLVYGKYWNHASSAPLLINGKKDVFVSVKPDGSSKQMLKAFDTTPSSYIQTILYHANEVAFRLSKPGGQAFYELVDGKVDESTALNDNNFYSSYPTYLISPSGDKTLWYEQRDGKNIIFAGDKNGANGKEVATGDAAFLPYGWYTDDYLLLSKDASELYIVPRDNINAIKPLKITDYHRPTFDGRGYGYGYGGF